MQSDILDSLRRLSDAELVGRVMSLAARERHATAHLVAHLAELDTRDVHLREGYPSLFAYCVEALGLSEGEAGNRIEAARAARRFPIILDLFSTGEVTLTAVRLLAPHLTEANHREVLESARGKRKAQIEEIVARLSPRPDARASARRMPQPEPEPTRSRAPALLPAAPSSGSAVPAGGGDETPAVSTPPDAAMSVMAAAPTPVARAAVTPLAPDRYRLQLTVPGETLEKLRLAKDMLAHAIPSGDDAAILDRALTALLADVARKKFADTPKPRTAGAVKPGTRHVPAAVKRAVWMRDLGRCAFLGTNGHRCNERRLVEFHHVDPFALGGEATVAGIALLCRRHNDYEGRSWFGKRRGDGSDSVRERPAAYGVGRLAHSGHVPEHVRGNGPSAAEARRGSGGGPGLGQARGQAFGAAWILIR